MHKRYLLLAGMLGLAAVPSGTRAACIAHVLERLNGAQVDYVVVGGMAAVFHGVPLVTRDIDICPRRP